MRAALTRLRDAARAIDPRDPFVWVVAVFVVACVAGAGWDLPCTDAWHNDALAPRPAGLGAVVETWRWGHFFRYPPLHLALLTVLSLPWILLAVVRTGGGGQDALARALIEPQYMTPVDVTGRLVALAMAVGIIVNVRRLVARVWGDRAGVAAAAVTALNPVLVYFAHSANSDVPYLFWATLALVELDRVMAGEGRERRAMLCVTAALLTKDQSLTFFILAAPWALVVGPALARGERSLASVLLRPALWRAVALGVGVYLVVSGAVTNPLGYYRRLQWITGPANKDWVVVGRDTAGVATLAREVLAEAPRFASRAVAALSLAGLVAAVATGPRARRARALLPAVVALSYFLFFTLTSRWTMERHVLPLAVFLFAYAGVAVEHAARAAGPRMGALIAIGFGLSLAPQALDVASVDGTLMADPRDEARRFLAALPAGTTLEIYGGNQYLPNLPRALRVTRVGPEPVGDRSPLPGVTELLAPYLDVTARAPEYALLSEDVARLYIPADGPLSPFLERLNRDPDGRGLIAGLLDGGLGYTWALRARCELPWPLRCVRMHRSIGADVWIFRRR